MPRTQKLKNHFSPSFYWKVLWHTPTQKFFENEPIKNTSINPQTVCEIFANYEFCKLLNMQEIPNYNSLTYLPKELSYQAQHFYNTFISSQFYLCPKHPNRHRPREFTLNFFVVGHTVQPPPQLFPIKEDWLMIILNLNHSHYFPTT